MTPRQNRLNQSNDRGERISRWRVALWLAAAATVMTLVAACGLLRDQINLTVDDVVGSWAEDMRGGMLTFNADGTFTVDDILPEVLGFLTDAQVQEIGSTHIAGTGTCQIGAPLDASENDPKDLVYIGLDADAYGTIAAMRMSSDLYAFQKKDGSLWLDPSATNPEGCQCKTFVYHKLPG